MSNQKEKTEILVALSGGVDSAVAAALLVSKGYNVTAAYMVNYDGKNNLGESCWVPDYQDAVRVAAALTIPILKFDFTREYQSKVLDYMFAEYEAGRTPNPDVLCNKYIKFGFWLDKAIELGFEYLATGHYARVQKEQGIKNKERTNNTPIVPLKGDIEPLPRGGTQGVYQLLQAKDTNKDQTYFLHQLNQEQLAHTLFPIGEYTKPEVRELAKKFNLPVAEKEESMGICFIGEVRMKKFLQTRIKPNPGKIITSSGEILGEHDGLTFYTIGQRQGVSVSLRGVRNERRGNPLDSNTKPLFVVAKNLATNELVVGFDTDPLLYKKEITVTEMNWISRHSPSFPLECEVRLRHRQPLQKCGVKEELRMNNEQTDNTPTVPLKGDIEPPPRGGTQGVFSITFEEPQRAPTPGQFAVFYKDGECLGGGVIK